MAELNEKEYLLIREIGRTTSLTQRKLSRQADLSLGMTNLLLKRLVRKGYVKVQQLNWRKIRYILTVRGTLEKARKSYAFAARTYNDFKNMAAVIQENILQEYKTGLRVFVISSPADLEEFIRASVSDLDLPGVRFIFQPNLKRALASHKTVFAVVPDTSLAHSRIIPILESPTPMAPEIEPNGLHNGQRRAYAI